MRSVVGLLWDVTALAGFALVLWGLGQVWTPAVPIAGGLVLIGVGVWGAKRWVS